MTKSKHHPKTDSVVEERRAFLKHGALAAGVAAASAGGLAAPYIRDAHAAETATWRIQTSWPGGIGLDIFKNWCATIVEKTGGELAFQAFGAKDVVGDFQLFDAVKNGVIEAMNPFTLYWAGRIPASVFLSSYPLGLRNPHEWDVFFLSLGGREIAREIFAQHDMFYVGHIHHGPNIIHSKVPILSIDDFRDRKMRLPGGMVAEVFQDVGAKTTLLPGSEIFPALDKERSMSQITLARPSTTRWDSTRRRITSRWDLRASCRFTNRSTLWTSPSAWSTGTRSPTR